MIDEFKDIFLEEASKWVCGSYSLDLRFFSIKESGNYVVQACSIGLSPLPLSQDNSFFIDADYFTVGQLQQYGMSKDEVVSFIEEAVDGKLNIYGKNLQLVPDTKLRYYSEMFHGDRWFYNLHLNISGKNTCFLEQNQVRIIDNELRTATPPFDGLHDALTWLGLGDKHLLTSRPSEINIWINPPIDLIFEECSFNKDVLKVFLRAHPDFDTSTAQLAICPAPRKNSSSSRQIAKELKWSKSAEGLNEGTAKINLAGFDSVLMLLLVNGRTVRRQWILDADKARNNRQIPVQYFDKELKMARKAVFDSPDSNKFEEGVALLLFMLGFTPAVQIETDSPDLITYTPGGKLVLVECTMRIADFSTKVGKLIDRRGGLEKSLKESLHHSVVYGALICRLPKDQIMTLGIDLRGNKIMLITKEGLEESFNLIRNGVDPDKLIDDAINNINDGK